MSDAERLWRGLVTLGLDLQPEAQRSLLDYVTLLAKWNRTYNLTAVRDETLMVSQHLLDSLAILPHLRGQSLVDIGSGGGLPGIPLAIAQPAWRVVLVESNQKKAAFLEQARMELTLNNVVVIHQRVESWQPEERFDMVVSRAFSDLSEFVRLSSHLLAPDGCFAAMKGLHPYEEIAQLPPEFAVTEVIPLAVPGVEGARHLVLIREV